ncbi:organic cation transporter protein-like isoform X1 [Apostichopus japonicus]
MATTDTTMNFEDTQKVVGSFGLYQKLLVALLCIPLLMSTCHVYLQVFAAGKSDHWCKSWVNDDCPTDLDDVDFNCEDVKKSLSIPIIIDEDNSTKYEQCTKYDVGNIDLQTAIVLGDNVTNELEVIPCDEGWEYDRSTFRSTIIQDFELVCGKDYLPNVAQSLYFVGYLFGSALPGIMSDVFGRRWTFIVCITGMILMGVANTFSMNIWMFIVLRFFVGIFAKGINLIGFVIVVELVAPSKRVIVSNTTFIFFAIGYYLIAGIAYLIPNWRIVQLVISLPYIPVLILALIFVPESPRWLISNKRFESAENIFRKIAKVNRKTLSDNFGKMVEQTNEEDQQNSMFQTVRKFVCSRSIFLITMNMSFNWIVQSLVFYGLSLSTSSLGIDPYIAFLISGTIEIPAYFLCMFVAEWFGRRGSTCGVMLLGGICCCVTPLIPLGIWRALVAMLGKFFISMSFSIVYSWASELTPTIMRNSGLGFFSTVSRVGGILSPLILLLENVWTHLPILVFGSCSIIAGLLCLLMPETKGKPLPATIQDTKALYRNVHPVAESRVKEKEDAVYEKDISP